MKAKLEFNMDDFSDKKSHTRAVNATNAYLAFFDIANQIFRPARKHGYSDSKIEELIEKCGEDDEGNSLGCELISKLENKFYEILEEYNINLDDLE